MFEKYPHFPEAQLVIKRLASCSIVFLATVVHDSICIFVIQ